MLIAIIVNRQQWTQLVLSLKQLVGSVSSLYWDVVEEVHTSAHSKHHQLTLYCRKRSPAGHVLMAPSSSRQSFPVAENSAAPAEIDFGTF